MRVTSVEFQQKRNLDMVRGKGKGFSVLYQNEKKKHIYFENLIFFSFPFKTTTAIVIH